MRDAGIVACQFFNPKLEDEIREKEEELQAYKLMEDIEQMNEQMVQN